MFLHHRLPNTQFGLEVVNDQSVRNIRALGNRASGRAAKTLSGKLYSPPLQNSLTRLRGTFLTPPDVDDLQLFCLVYLLEFCAYR